MLDRTLVIGPSWVGDMVMAQPLFEAIQSNYPHTSIEVLAPAWSQPLTDRMPEISRSIIAPFQHGELNLRDRYRLGKELKNRFARCFVLPNSLKSALIPFWAKIPIRIGWMRECRYPFINKPHWLNKKDYPLMVQRYVALAYPKKSALPTDLRPRLKVVPESVNEVLHRFNLTLEKPILILCPGAEFGPSKCWPKEYYRELSQTYLKRDWQVWILGSAKDKDVAKVITGTANNHCHDLTGKTQLGEAIDLMSVATIVVSNDSGLMHIAAALSRPLVAIYGSTSPKFTPPLSDKVKILQEDLSCSPCFKRTCPLKHHQCMKQIGVSKVIHALNDSLGII